jgi:cysteine desulfurase / selenocysteine lyase
MIPGDDRIETWRELFPITEKWICLNHAGTSPNSTRVRDAVNGLLDDVLSNGPANAGSWWAHYDEIRANTAAFLGVKSRSIAFAKNTSEGISFAATGFPWKQGDEVVVPAMEFPSNRFPWLHLSDLGVKTVLVQDRAGCLPVEDLVSAMTPRTRVLAISAVQYLSGFRVDLASLGDECRKRGILFVVDGIQAMGHLPFHPEEVGADVVAADAHKWLLGPEGIAVVYLSDRALDVLRVSEVGWASAEKLLDFEAELLTLNPGARRFECGTHTGIAVYGFGAALELIREVGIDVISRRIMALADRVREACRERGWQVYGSTISEEMSGIVAIDTGGDASAQMRALMDRGVLAAARGGRVRFAPHFYNTADEIDRALELLDEITRS